MTRGLFTTLSTYGTLTAVAALSLTLPDSLPLVHAAVPPSTQGTVFYVSAAPSGPVFGSGAILDAVEYPSGGVCDRFITALRISHLDCSAATTGRQRLAQRLAESQGDADLGHLVEIPAGAYSFILEFEQTVHDSEPALDDVGELLVFERGRGAGDSWFLLEAVDEKGQSVGRPQLVGPRELHSTVPPSHVRVGRSRTEEVGAAAIDLTRLGVPSLRFLRVSSPHLGRNGFVGGDIAADLKILAAEP
jgi:hypothetical protein